MSTADKLRELKETTYGAVERLVTLSLESEVDHRAGDSLREEVLRWCDSIKADSLIHIALHMIGFGYKFTYDARDRLEQQGQNIDPELKLRSLAKLEEAENRVTTIARMAIDAEKKPQTAEELRQEVRKWVASANPDTLGHFATHIIGTAVVFANLVDGKMKEIPN
jgi:hypothetical protein